MLDKLHTNQKLLVIELQKLGASIEILDLDDELLEISYNNKKEFLLDRFSSVVPFHTTKITADKHLAKNILYKNKIATPEGNVFLASRLNECLQYANALYPVVLKPNWGSHGDGVSVDIRNDQELKRIINDFAKSCGLNTPFIIEKFYPWKEYRVFITSKAGFAVVHREPASIVGNGVQSIKELAQIESNNRLKLKTSSPTSLCPLILDEEVNNCLLKQNLDINDVPALDQKIYLRMESNLAKGGKAIDMTDEVHDDIKNLAIKTLSAFPGLPCAGLDLLCEDITKPLTDDNHVIIEINSSPGLAMHTYPSQGKSRNVAGLLLDVMFPDFFV